MISSIFRSLPAFKGKSKLARTLLKNALTKKNDLPVNGKFGCSYFLPNATENVGFDIFVNGIYEPETHEILKNLIPKNGVFVDIGANIGSITIPLAKRRPDVKMIAIEAAPWIYKYLEKNIRLNGIQNVKLYNNAVYDKNGLMLDFFSPVDKFGKGSLAPVFTKEAVKIETRRIDTILTEQGFDHIDVIKVDVEGFEYFVFQGGSEFLEKPNAPVIFFEFVDWAEELADGLKPGMAQKLLIEMGYELFLIEGGRLEKINGYLTSGSFNILAKK